MVAGCESDSPGVEADAGDGDAGVLFPETSVSDSSTFDILDGQDTNQIDDADSVDTDVDGINPDDTDGGPDVSDISDVSDTAEVTAEVIDTAEVTDTSTDSEVGGPDAGDADTAEVLADVAPDVPVDPCLSGPDTDGDGRVDACDECPRVPRILIFDLHSDRRFAHEAIVRSGCDFEVAEIQDVTSRLASGEFGMVILDMPDARPEGAWAQALLDHVGRGGAAIIAGQRLGNVSGPSVPATMGATWGAERTAPVAWSPTWTVPVFARPNTLTRAGFQPDLGSNWSWNGAPLTATAGRIWARAGTEGVIVESNGGRTFLNGFIFDDYPYDTDGDLVVDIIELIGNQIVSAANARITTEISAPYIDNFTANEVVRYDLPILRGYVDDASDDIVVHRADTTHVFPVADGRFKALAPLTPGENWVTLESVVGGEHAFTHLELDYLPQTNPRRMRMVYAVASDGDGRFDAPFGESNFLASAKRRLAFTGRLMQSMLADRMYAAGLGRHTFNLMRDVAHEPEVHVWSTTATTAQWHAMDGLQMWSWIWANMAQLPSCGDCKTVIVLGMTRYDAANNRALAHTALGGGGVALFGSGTLHTFAESLDDLVERFEDTRDVMSLQPPLFDDSGFRRSMWANYATGIGAILHEVAHAMDLPHAVDYGDIVNRGFDHVNRLVMTQERASVVTQAIPVIHPQHEPIFSTPNIGRLRWHRYAALDNRAYTVSTSPQVSLVGQEIRITTPAGLRVVGYARDVSGDWQMASGALLLGAQLTTSYTIPKSSLSFLFPTESRIRIYLTDDQGNMNDGTIVTLP